MKGTFAFYAHRAPKRRGRLARLWALLFPPRQPPSTFQKSLAVHLHFAKRTSALSDD